MVVQGARAIWVTFKRGAEQDERGVRTKRWKACHGMAGPEQMGIASAGDASE